MFLWYHDSIGKVCLYSTPSPDWSDSQVVEIQNSFAVVQLKNPNELKRTLTI